MTGIKLQHQVRTNKRSRRTDSRAERSTAAVTAALAAAAAAAAATRYRAPGSALSASSASIASTVVAKMVLPATHEIPRDAAFYDAKANADVAAQGAAGSGGAP